MPTKNPRLTITLQPALADQLRRLSALTGNSQSALISELLDGSGPVFDRMISILEAAKQATSNMRGKIAADLETAQNQLENVLGIALDHMSDAEKAIVKKAGKTGGEPRRKAQRGGARSASLTPPSNRGVRCDPNATKKKAQNVRPVSHSAKRTTKKTSG